MRRAGRPVADPAFTRFDAIDTAPLDAILEAHDFDPKDLLAILEETQAEYGYLPVAALKHISRVTGAWYAMIYGTATLLPAPAVRAAGDQRRARRRRGTSGDRAGIPLRARCLPRPRRRESLLMATFLTTPGDWARVLTGRIDAISADPGDLDAAVRAGAFEGLRVAVRDLGATGTIATLAAAGLRGRGGAGFPTGEKWRAAASQPADQRYVVANGYGADPAVQTDATLMFADPWAVIEGLVIAAFATGATQAILAVRAGDPALDRAPGGRRRGGRGGRLCRRRRARARATTSPSASAPSRARTCWARKPCCSRRWRAGAASPSSGLRGPPSAACSAGRPWSTTSRRWPPCRGSSGRAEPRMRRSARRSAPGPSSSSCAVPRARAWPRSRWARPFARWSRSPAEPAVARSRPSWSAVPPVACSLPTCWTRPTSSMHCGRPAPTSAPARS